MRVLCQDLRPRRPGEDSDQLWGPHGVDRRRRSRTPVPSGQKHWMGGAAWQPDLWPLAGSVPRLSPPQ